MRVQWHRDCALEEQLRTRASGHWHATMAPSQDDGPAFKFELGKVPLPCLAYLSRSSLRVG